MNSILIFCCVVSVAVAMPEAPRSRYGPAPVPHENYGPPPAPQKEYGPPPPPPQKEYGPPPAPQKEYGPPPAPQREYGSPVVEQAAQPLPVYGPPEPFYGPPAPIRNEAIVTKNVYVHVPPAEPEGYPAAAPIQTTVPKKHYKIIFIKAPNPPTPVRQVVPPPAQDEHKTLVYVLVKKPEDQQPLILPSPAPTEPSKPEVYFIKYKQQPKLTQQYGPPQAPSSEYGPPSQAEKF